MDSRAIRCWKNIVPIHAFVCRQFCMGVQFGKSNFTDVTTRSLYDFQFALLYKDGW